MTSRLATVAALASCLAVVGPLGAGCAADAGDAGDDLDEAAELSEGQLAKAKLFERVVIGRAFQTGSNTLPPADYTGDGVPDARDANYVCSVLVKLKPTLVSGLLRYGAKRKDKDGHVIPRDEVTEEQRAFFDAVRGCMKANGLGATKFDVVLNADEYETPAEFVDHLRAIHAALHPDGWYFDFLARGWDNHQPVVRAAVEWVHAKSRDQFVGGTIWGEVVPTGVDYVALDDYDQADAQDDGVSGWQRMTKQAHALRAEHPGLPLLFHIENNPTGKENNHGDDFVESDTKGRMRLIEKHAKAQSSVGYRYMYPVFFPLSHSRAGALSAWAPDPADPSKETYKGQPLAYDAALDANMLDRMLDLMREHNALSKSSSSSSSSGGSGVNACDTAAELKTCRAKCEKAYASQSKTQACKAECEKKCD